MISDNLQTIKQEIQDSCALANRKTNEVTLVAVSKTVTDVEIKQLYDAGVSHFAENRVEPFLVKREKLQEAADIKWHFIGNLQRRKVKRVINEIDYFHALDSLKLAQEIQKRAEKKIRCFVEINVSGEDSKHGIAPEALEHFIEELEECDRVEVVGLMTMAPYDSTEEEQHEIFAALKKMQQMIAKKKLKHAPCTELSMGMSNDFSVAITEGATFVRVGTALFKE